VDSVCRWPFTRIVPCHLANNIQAGPEAFRAAFDFLYSPSLSTSPQSLPWWKSFLDRFSSSSMSSSMCPVPKEADLSLLTSASRLLSGLGILFPLRGGLGGNDPAILIPFRSFINFETIIIRFLIQLKD